MMAALSFTKPTTAAMAPLVRCRTRRAGTEGKMASQSNGYKSNKKVWRNEDDGNAAMVASRDRVTGFGKGEKKMAPKWQCSRGCGACCKLDKGPSFPSPEEIFIDDPNNLQLYKSLIGPDGWCIHYESSTRTCSIYEERPFFCRVEPDVFQKLYGVDPKRFNREACSSCRDTISSIYGSASEELKLFNQNLWNS
ncbi:uncharacterized protein LOC120251192 [Dioscorea cayenensis subsp. rotundata]|uniref:Uncharacterized protein LOC120251192 n=1 Tax=Dioscorea cayennensis subsp. rotundata TaxID=55577 RepID=A0AB40ALI1_DIOCR|nr:uncharacterized protein LOC120251192 [Dioscorea cayenensis subsp. rotundata]